MKIKNIILLFFIFNGIEIFASDAIINRNYSVNQKSAIEFSNYYKKLPVSSDYDKDIIEPAVIELSKKIRRNPDDYMLYANLSDIFLKSKQYEKSIDNLTFLYNLKKNSKLDDDTIAVVSRMFDLYKGIKKKDSGLCLNLAAISLILDNDKAVDYVIAGVESSNNEELSRKAMELVFDSEQNPKKAISSCEKILEKKPNNIAVRKIKALYHTQIDEPKIAVIEYSKILQLNPDEDNSRYYMYKIISKYKNIDDKTILKSLYGMRTPFSLEEAYVSITELLLNNSDFMEAEKYAQVLIKKYNNNPNGYILLAEINKRRGDVKGAYDTLSLAKDKADNNETIAKYNVMLAKLSDEPIKEANSLIAAGLYAQALDVLESANPESLYVILAQARANYLLENKQKTFDFLNKAMSLYSENSDVYCAFGYIYLQEKDTKTARNYVNKSLKLDADNQTAKDLLNLINREESSKYISGIFDAIDLQNYSEALRLVEEAMAIDKNSADLYYYKSLIYIAQSNYKASISALHKCLELSPDYTEAYFYLGASYDNIGDEENAKSYYNKFINKSRGQELEKSEKIELAKSRLAH